MAMLILPGGGSVKARGFRGVIISRASLRNSGSFQSTSNRGSHSHCIHSILDPMEAHGSLFPFMIGSAPIRLNILFLRLQATTRFHLILGNGTSMVLPGFACRGEHIVKNSNSTGVQVRQKTWGKNSDYKISILHSFSTNLRRWLDTGHEA